jgi:hypothetical protein
MIRRIHPSRRALVEPTASQAARLGFVILLSIATPHPLLAVETVPGTTVWQAPVGHRQPSASDVIGSLSVNGVGTTRVLDAEDRELSRKLKICRGC